MNSTWWDDDVPSWLRSAIYWLWTHGKATEPSLLLIVAAIAVVAALMGNRFVSTDPEQADADVKAAWNVVFRLEAETEKHLKEARFLEKSAAKRRAILVDNANPKDPVWMEWLESAANCDTKTKQAHFARRDNLLAVTAEYRRLLAHAEIEILRAKDANDRGTPLQVGPRVRNILAPILANR